MKNIFKIITAAVCAAGLFSACETQYDSPVLNSNVTKPVITSTVPASAVVLAENLETAFAKIIFTPAEYSTPVPVTNQLQLSLNNSFPAGNTVLLGAATSDKTVELTYKMLNQAAVAAGAQTLVANTVYIRVKSSVNATTGSPSTELSTAYSDVKQIVVTPYEPQPAYVYLVGEFNGWNRTGGYSLVSMTDNGIYIGYLNFSKVNSEFLILPNNNDDWSFKWGSDDGAKLIAGGGANIKSPAAGWQQITADLNALTIAFTPYSWGIIGDATPTGWDGDSDMTWNCNTLKWEATLNLVAGGAKFRFNDDWGVNYGGSGLSSTAVAGGGNIAITEAGTYFITLDLINMEYSFVKQ